MCLDTALVGGHFEKIVNAASGLLVDANHGNLQPLISFLVLFFRDLRWRTLLLFGRHLLFFIQFWFFTSDVVLFKCLFKNLVALEHSIIGTRFDLLFEILEQIVDHFLVVWIRLRSRFQMISSIFLANPFHGLELKVF